MRNRSTIQCSRCKVDAEIVSLGPIDVDHCSLCGNVWFDNRELEKASAAADGASGADFRDAVRCMAPVHAKSPVGPAVLACPFCSDALVRRPHPHAAALVAHTCLAHGVWVERTHLLEFFELIGKLGLTGLGEPQRRRDGHRADRLGSMDAHIRNLQKLRLRR